MLTVDASKCSLHGMHFLRIWHAEYELLWVKVYICTFYSHFLDFWVNTVVWPNKSTITPNIAQKQYSDVLTALGKVYQLNYIRNPFPLFCSNVLSYPERQPPWFPGVTMHCDICQRFPLHAQAADLPIS